MINLSPFNYIKGKRNDNWNMIAWIDWYLKQTPRFWEYFSQISKEPVSVGFLAKEKIHHILNTFWSFEPDVDSDFERID